MQLTLQLVLYRLGTYWMVYLAVSLLLLYLAWTNDHPDSNDPVLIKQRNWLAGLGVCMLLVTLLAFWMRISLQVDYIRT